MTIIVLTRTAMPVRAPPRLLIRTLSAHHGKSRRAGLETLAAHEHEVHSRARHTSRFVVAVPAHRVAARLEVAIGEQSHAPAGDVEHLEPRAAALREIEAHRARVSERIREWSEEP